MKGADSRSAAQILGINNKISGNNAVSNTIAIFEGRCRQLPFMVVSSIVAGLIVWFMPKRLTRQEIYSTWLLMVFVSRLADQLLDLYFHLYDQMGPGLQWQVVAIQMVFPCAVGVIILNYAPMDRLKFLLYTMGCVLCSILFEWITLRIDYLTYNNWSLWYSAGLYTAGIILLRFHLSFLRRNSKGKINNPLG